MYRLWAHKMYPKMTFGDTVTKVESLCHSRLMSVSWPFFNNCPRFFQRYGLLMDLSLGCNECRVRSVGIGKRLNEKPRREIDRQQSRSSRMPMKMKTGRGNGRVVDQRRRITGIRVGLPRPPFHGICRTIPSSHHGPERGWPSIERGIWG
jgi:hypothetical protein